MTKNRSGLVHQLYRDACEQPSGTRGQWLVEKCEGDSGLVREVQSLIDQNGSSVDSPMGNVGTSPATTIMSASEVHSGVDEEPSTAEDRQHFLSKLSEVGILSEDELQEISAPDADGDAPLGPRELAAQLVSNGKLTKYQANALLKGQPELLIDKYLIIDLLDVGGMGMVFKALHRPMNRIVAVKMISPKLLSSPEQVKRFQREVQLAATLEHPNIVRSYDADQSNGAHFLVMEFVRGQNLSKLVNKKGPLTAARALNCIQQAARGLRYANKHGVIHRDIKPGNLMLSRDGLVKVLDMGLASIDKSLQLNPLPDENDPDASPDMNQSYLTEPGTILGTVTYMAPEQTLDASKADTRSDIYSLGCTLYYLLTGDPPYQGDTVIDVFLKHKDADVPSLHEKRPDIAPAVDPILQRMMAKDPQDRFQTMGEVMEAIEGCSIDMTDVQVASKNSPRKQTEQLPQIRTKPRQSSKNTSRRSKTKSSTSKQFPWWIAVPLGVMALVVIAVGADFLFSSNEEVPVSASTSDDDDVGQQNLADIQTTNSSVLGSGDESSAIEGESNAEQQVEPQEPLADLLATGDYEWRIIPDVFQNVNSTQPEYGADMTADGLTLVFSSHRSGGYGKSDLWISTRESTDVPFSTPVNLGSAINSPGYENNPTLTADGGVLFFRQEIYGDNGHQTIMQSVLIGDQEYSGPVESPIARHEWMPPSAFSKPNLNSDGLNLLLMSYAGAGDANLYLTTRRSLKESWPRPVVLQAQVRTKAQESSGTLSDDGRVVVVERNEIGQKHPDLFAHIRSDANAEWGPAIPLDSLNSEFGELIPQLLPDGRTLLFASDRLDSTGRMDLYLAELVKKETSSVAAVDAEESGE
ncbi:serine/threonine-protein kinase [Thalassoglobus sp. JC818]|uniref:serine/threonine protein kinase n=1 Tax=Thalassoglobus sp. JC818 TaxID=3232136 RepID=UPI003459EC65